MGNSQETARKHYLKVRDGHFDRATEPIGLHEGLQQSAAAGRNDSQAEEGAHEKTLGKSKTQRLAASADTPGRIRTSNPRFRRPVLYPVELRMREA